MSSKLIHVPLFLGIFVALALRFDVSRGKENRYFRSAFFGYTVGVILTIIVMNWFQAGQVILLAKCMRLLFLSDPSLVLNFILAFAASTSIYCTCCNWICCCLLHAEWWSKTGLFCSYLPFDILYCLLQVLPCSCYILSFIDQFFLSECGSWERLDYAVVLFDPSLSLSNGLTFNLVAVTLSTFMQP